jgi:hypothetical protein
VFALLVTATIADLGLAALLVAISGFIFGSGPEGLAGDPGASGAWIAALSACLAAPVVGFLLRWRGLPRAGATVALVPAMLGLIIGARRPVTPQGKSPRRGPRARSIPLFCTPEGASRYRE